VSRSGSQLPAKQKLFEFSSDALKVVLGALLGVLSLVANQTFNPSTTEQDNATGAIQEQGVGAENIQSKELSK